MATEPDNLVLELLRALRTEVASLDDRTTQGLREVRDRLHALEQGQVYVIRNLRQTDEDVTRERSELHGRIDHLLTRIESLEQQARPR